MIGVNATVLRNVLIIALGGFIFGVDAAIIGGVIPYLTSDPMNFNATQVGLIVTAPTLAAVLASFTIGFLSDVYGRKRILIFLAGLYCISAFLSAIAAEFWIFSDFAALFVARAIGGYAFGALSQGPVFIAEISPTRARGKMVGINQLTIVTGFAAAYFSNLAVQTFTGAQPGVIVEDANMFVREPWRLMLGAELIPALIWFLAMFHVPESPRWLATKGRWEESKSALVRFFGKDEADERYTELQELMAKEQAEHQSRFGELFDKKIIYVMLLGLMVGVIQQITGINVIFFYATSIFQLSGIGTDAAFLQTVSVGVVNVVVTIIALALVDRIGRRPLMNAGVAFVAIAMAIISYGFLSASYKFEEADLSLKNGESCYQAQQNACDAPRLLALAPEALGDEATRVERLQTALSSMVGVTVENEVDFKSQVAAALDAAYADMASTEGFPEGSQLISSNEATLLKVTMDGNPAIILFGVLLFVAAFAMSLGPIMWIFLSEIFPARVRGTAISLITVVNSGTAALVTFMFPILVKDIGAGGVFMGFAIISAVSLLILLKFMPETKGKSLEMLEEELTNQH